MHLVYIYWINHFKFDWRNSWHLVYFAAALKKLTKNPRKQPERKMLPNTMWAMIHFLRLSVRTFRGIIFKHNPGDWLLFAFLSFFSFFFCFFCFWDVYQSIIFLINTKVFKAPRNTVFWLICWRLRYFDA